MNLLRKLWQRKDKEPLPPERSLSPLHDTGFHGDQYLLQWTDTMLATLENFIETGANVGTTLRYVASRYPHLKLYSCEPDPKACAAAKQHTQEFKHVHVYQKLSPQFLYDLFAEYPHLGSADNFYWLDAHDYGFRWPLHDEIAFITSTAKRGIIAIDDSKIPDRPEFQYSTYGDQTSDLEYITGALIEAKIYQIGYANYTERTSKHHPLVGVIFVAFGGLSLPESEFFTITDFKKDAAD